MRKVGHLGESQIQKSRYHGAKVEPNSSNIERHHPEKVEKLPEPIHNTSLPCTCFLCSAPTPTTNLNQNVTAKASVGKQRSWIMDLSTHPFQIEVMAISSYSIIREILYAFNAGASTDTDSEAGSEASGPGENPVDIYISTFFSHVKRSLKKSMRASSSNPPAQQIQQVLTFQ